MKHQQAIFYSDLETSYGAS